MPTHTKNVLLLCVLWLVDCNSVISIFNSAADTSVLFYSQLDWLNIPTPIP